MEKVDKILKTFYNQYEEEATDGIAQAMQMYIDHLSEEEFEEWIKYHLATCERKDLMGYSTHVLHICQKK